MQSCYFGFEQHRGRWAVFSAAFRYAERGSRMVSSLTAESPTIGSFKTSLVSIRGFSRPMSCVQERLVNEIHAREMHAHEIHARKVHAHETPTHDMHACKMHTRKIHYGVAFPLGMKC